MNATGGSDGLKESAGGWKSSVYQYARWLSRLPGVSSIIPRQLRTSALNKLRPKDFSQFSDRRYMEEVILPAVVALAPKRVLDVGLEDYTKHYYRWYPADCEYWTIDINPNVVEFGRSGRHILGDLRDVTQYFTPASLDIVLMNGPFGYGIDTLQETEETLAAVHSRLNPGGWILVGWDLDTDGLPVVSKGRKPGDVRDPLELDIIRSCFDHVAPAGLSARKEFHDCSHVYDWFRSKT